MIDTLKAELQADPLGRGYAGMTAEEAAADLNSAYRMQTRTTLTGREILSRIEPNEYAAIPASQPHMHTTVMGICGVADEIDVGPGSFARSTLVAIFGSGSQTIARLGALLQQPITRAQELGLPEIKPGYVEEARRA